MVSKIFAYLFYGVSLEMVPCKAEKKCIPTSSVGWNSLKVFVKSSSSLV